MIPIWIIDLGSCSASTEKLNSLLQSTGDALRPYWHYVHVEESPVTDVVSCKALMDKLVSDGRDCYNGFVKAGYDVGNFQIVILGAADEQLTQSIFAALPGLLRDNLPRIISDHTNRGVETTGILYIPNNINQLDDVENRTRAALLLEEVNTVCEQLGPKHFNRVVAYQDIQYIGARFYPRLDTEQRTELLYQILVNLFFVGAKSERLFDKIGRDSGVFSLGTASIYYNSEHHHGSELKRLLDKLIKEFKDTDNHDDDYSGKIVREVLEADTLDTDSVTTRLMEGCGSLDIDLKKMEAEANPHPVWDLFCVNLFNRYYKKFLKYLPARLTRFMQSLSYVLLTRFSGIIRRNREKAVEYFTGPLRGFYKKVFLDTAAQYATIAQMESVFEDAKQFLLKKRAEVVLTLQEIVPIPKYLRNDYDKCVADEESNKPSAIMDKIKKNLKKEPVVFSLIARCFLLGILLVFTVIPVIRVLSPRVINLGGIATIEWLWIPVLFFLPFIIHFVIKLRRHFLRLKRLGRRLLAITLLAVNKRLSQFLMDEQGLFYDALVKECEQQLHLLSEFREKISVPEVEAGKNTIPQTLFNQPLLEGEFCGEKLLKDPSVTEAEIRVNDEKLLLSQLEKAELLTMLKESFRHPETFEAADLSDYKETAQHAETFVSVLRHQFGTQLHIHTADNIGSMLSLLNKQVDITPMQKMAGVGGMLFSVASNNIPVLQITNCPNLFGNVSVVADSATTDYALLTYWQSISQGIQSQHVCNCTLSPLPTLSFADKLSLYYSFYRRKDLAYVLAGTPVRIAKEEMDLLDKQIKEGSI